LPTAAAREEQSLPLANPVAAGKLEEEPAVEPPDGTKVGVLDLGLVAQAGSAGSGLDAFLATQRRSPLEQQGEPVAVLQDAASGCASRS
jgi:hypothetical protein